MRKIVVSALLTVGTLFAACSQRAPEQLVLPALSQAIVNGSDSARILKLIAEAPNVDVTDSIGATPLLYAAGLHKSETGDKAPGALRASDDAIVRALVERGANVNAVTRNGQESVLHVLVYHRRAEAISVVLEHGANPNVRAGAMTPLMLASYRCYPEVVQLLLSAGADRTSKDAAGFTARAHAEAQQCAAAVAML